MKPHFAMSPIRIGLFAVAEALHVAMTRESRAAHVLAAIRAPIRARAAAAHRLRAVHVRAAEHWKRAAQECA
jgi:hypothetical protein